MAHREHLGDGPRDVAIGRLVAEWAVARQQFRQQHAERVEIGTRVEIVGRPLVPGVERLELLRRHVGQAAAKEGRGPV